MATLRPTPTSEKVFTRYAGMLVSELSTIGPMGRVYDDACDTGLTLVMADGREGVYAVHHDKRNAEGELVYVELMPVRGDAAAYVPIRLYND